MIIEGVQNFQVDSALTVYKYYKEHTFSFEYGNDSLLLSENSTVVLFKPDEVNTDVSTLMLC